MFLTSDQAVLTLRSSAKKSSVVRMQLAGANPAADATGSSQLPSRSNYLIGNDPSKWRRDVPQFARVRYPGGLSGVDPEYYVSRDSVVRLRSRSRRGSQPDRVRFQGQESADLDDGGNLILASGGDQVKLNAPRICQIWRPQCRWRGFRLGPDVSVV